MIRVYVSVFLLEKFLQTFEPAGRAFRLKTGLPPGAQFHTVHREDNQRVCLLFTDPELEDGETGDRVIEPEFETVDYIELKRKH